MGVSEKTAILVISFGTSYAETRKKTIEQIESDLHHAYPEYPIYRAWTSARIRAKLLKRDGIHIMDIDEAMTQIKTDGIRNVIVQPTYVITGFESDAMKEKVLAHKKDFDSVIICDSLMVSKQDKEEVCQAMVREYHPEADEVLLFMGHGTEHMADSSYRVMEQALRAYARKPVYIATVEGKRTIQDVINDMREEGIVNTGVFLAPLMLVAGDHANNDMAGDDESFATILKANGYTPQCVIKGIGEYPAVRQVYLSHLQKAVKALENVSDTDNLPDKKSGILYGIGVGTGNPKQMTLQELEVIKSCDLIVIPAVSKEECYAYRIAEQACSEISTKPVLCMPFPMIKDEGKLEISHNKIYEAIEEYLYQGKKIGMITIGDPSIYSTYMYMHKRARANGWRAEIVSGVPSFCAVAARLGISLGEKGEEIHIIPSSDNIENTFSYNGTLIYMKSGRGLKQLVKALRARQEAGEMYEINAVSNCGMDSEKIYHSLEELENADVYLTTVIVKRKKKNN